MVKYIKAIVCKRPVYCIHLANNKVRNYSSNDTFLKLIAKRKDLKAHQEFKRCLLSSKLLTQRYSKSKIQIKEILLIPFSTQSKDHKRTVYMYF